MAGGLDAAEAIEGAIAATNKVCVFAMTSFTEPLKTTLGYSEIKVLMYIGFVLR